MEYIYKPWVYIASPYSVGDKLENVREQIRVAETLVMNHFTPIWPLASHYWDEIFKHEYDYWMCLDKEYIKRCDYLLRLPGVSKGADQEVEWAREMGKPVFYDVWQLLYHEYKIRNLEEG